MCRVYENFLRITLENGDMTSDESIFSMMVFRFPSLMTLLNRGVFSDLMSGFTIQSYHYLTNVQHRKFIFKADGTYDFEQLSLKK
jgi:sulfite exporter TauE/SafE